MDFEQLFSKKGEIIINAQAYGLIYFQDLKVDSEGNLVVLDRNYCRILLFDKNGDFIKTFGRRGNGPGEFRYPISLAIDSKDCIFVLDFSLIRLSKYRRDEGFLDSFILSGGHDPIGRIKVDSRSCIYLSGFKRGVKRNLDYGTWINKYTPEGKFQFSFFSSHRLNRNWVSRIDPSCSFDIDQDDMIYAIQHCAYEICKYHSDGKLLRTFGNMHHYFKPPDISHKVDFKRFDTQSGLIKKLSELSVSWTKIIDLIIIGNRYLLIVMETNKLVKGCDKKYMIDIWDKDGNLVAGPIATNYRLLCKDVSDHLYFAKNELEDTSRIINGGFIIEKFRLSLDYSSKLEKTK